MTWTAFSTRLVWPYYELRMARRLRTTLKVRPALEIVRKIEEMKREALEHEKRNAKEEVEMFKRWREALEWVIYANSKDH